PYFTSIEMGVEILGHLHLVVLPPSLHPDTGKLYTWDPAYNPFTMPAPAMAPDWLLHLVLDVHAKKSSGRARVGIHTREAADAVEDGVKPPEDGYAEGATKVPKGFIPPGPPTVSPPQST